MSESAFDHPADPEEHRPNPAVAQPTPLDGPDPGSQPEVEVEGPPGSDPASRRRRRGSRGGRSRARPAGGPATADDASATLDRPLTAPGPAGAAEPVATSRPAPLVDFGAVPGRAPAAVPAAAAEPAAGDRPPAAGDRPPAADVDVPPEPARPAPPAGDAPGGPGLPDRPGPLATGPTAGLLPGSPGAAGLLPPPGPAPAPGPRPKIGDSRPAPVVARRPPRTRGGPAAGVGAARDGSPAGGAPTAAGGGGPATDGQREPPAGAAGPGDGDQSGRRRRRRGGRGRLAGPDDRPVESVVGAPFDLDDDLFESRRGRERKGRPVGRYLMIVNVRPLATQIAVLEGRALIEHYVSHPSDDVLQIDGNIYLGRVQNVLPGMEAAFVDIGTPKNAVLYRGDVRFDRDEVEGEGPNDAAEGAKSGRGRGGGSHRDARIEQLLKAGQTIVCQVTKNPIGTKGARLTQEVSLPGRFVVLIPNSDTYGISKRLADDERKRLRRILDDIRPAGHGLIVRTAAEGATADELRRDVARLMSQWERIDSLARRSRAPALLYREPDMAVRVIREEFNKDYRGVVIDDQALYEEVRDYVASISPELADRVEYAGDSDSPLPVFERFHVHEQIHRALDRKVWLPSGGSLIIERTEALTVIDVNTGKNVGTSNLEETVYRNNLEAAEEIARQLRLRDIGGIIVIDFIDMEIAANRASVIRTFREALARDKTRTQVFDISELGLVEMTRKRISEGLVESFSESCPMCGGRGIVIDESLL